LQSWAAYTPGYITADVLRESKVLADELAVDVSFLAPLSRRRLSGLSRLSLRLAHECVPGFQGYCVFGSQHGELQTTQKLLESIVGGELLSPAGFSSSVHNTAVGLHSINNRNTYPCTSIAAGVDTLVACFIEAFSILDNNQADEVLVVFADDRIPQDLANYLDNENEMHGFAALVKKGGDGQQVQLTSVSEQIHPVTTGQVSALIQALSSSNDSVEVTMAGESAHWRWVFP